MMNDKSSTTVGTTRATSSSSSAAAVNVPVDMSTKIGGRIVKPALPVVDSSIPTPLERSFNESLHTHFISDHIPLETTEGIQRRERVLNRMGTLCRDWIKSVCKKRGLPNDVVESAGGQLFTSGSYRLGVHEPGADIDTILVAPNVCTRQDFFGTISMDNTMSEEEQLQLQQLQQQMPRDPESLAERIRVHPDVTNFVPVEGAAVPILTFDWEGVNIDLLFARLNSASVPADFDIDNDAVLDGVDGATEKSLNGPRVTNLIAALVSGTPERYQTFLTVVRCVRKWAKARGLYSNKMGYWGGVNINIAVALCVQLYPLTPPASLLRKFFLVFRTWRWPNPIMLTKPHDAGFGLHVWSPTQHNNARQVAPIITPAYPAMNSTLAVSRQTLQIMHEEFCRGHEIMDRLWKDHQQQQHANTGASSSSSSLLDWEELFRPSDFFIAYPNYLSLCIVGPTQRDAQAWAGFVESRLRKLVSDMLGRSLPLSKIQLWPKKIEACIADRSALLTLGQRKNCCTYMVGFQVDTLRMRGRQLNIETQLSHFREWELSRFHPILPGMDVLVKHFDCKRLPKICFEIYDGGKEAAMNRRRILRNADPKRQERKRLKKLEELKAKMAELQRKKEEEQKAKEDQEKREAMESEGPTSQDDEDENDEENRKRKRSDSTGEDKDSAGMDDNEADDKVVKPKIEDNGDDFNDNEEDEQDKKKIRLVKEEDSNEEEKEDLGEEADLLESALDTLETGTGQRKTREEAEADRRKLLAGEMLFAGAGDDGVDGVGEDDSDDDLELGFEGATMDKSFLVKPKTAQSGSAGADGLGTNGAGNGGAGMGGSSGIHKDCRTLPLPQEDAEILRKAGYTVVSDADEDTKVIGGNMRAPFRFVSSEDEDDDDDDDENDDYKNSIRDKNRQTTLQIKFRTKFDIVELDTDGHVIDKGDDDFIPSKKWIGSKLGFEFKLGLRGLGYYRTGKKVVVPSNTAY